MDPAEDFASAVGSPEASESGGESNDDSQLTIRIPNPKMYMARQSQWKGRRGKPRCDHCRMNNLKVCLNFVEKSTYRPVVASAIESFPRAITVLGPTAESVNIRLSPRRLTEGFRDAIGVD